MRREMRFTDDIIGCVVRLLRDECYYAGAGSWIPDLRDQFTVVEDVQPWWLTWLPRRCQNVCRMSKVAPGVALEWLNGSFGNRQSIVRARLQKGSCWFQYKSSYEGGSRDIRKAFPYMSASVGMG